FPSTTSPVRELPRLASTLPFPAVFLSARTNRLRFFHHHYSEVIHRVYIMLNPKRSRLFIFGCRFWRRLITKSKIEVTLQSPFWMIHFTPLPIEIQKRRLTERGPLGGVVLNSSHACVVWNPNMGLAFGYQHPINLIHVLSALFLRNVV